MDSLNIIEPSYGIGYSIMHTMQNILVTRSFLYTSCNDSTQAKIPKYWYTLVNLSDIPFLLIQFMCITFHLYRIIG